jgi:hypothetical protein
MNAFYNCTGISGRLNIPNTVTVINNYAFYYCCSVTSLTIGTGVTTIGNAAFANMNKLVTINYNAKTVADKAEGNDVFCNAGVGGTGITLTIGNQVTKIPAYMFYPRNDAAACPKVTTLTFASTSVCKTIGDWAFNKLNDFTTLVIPNSVETIGAVAFRECTALTSLTIGTGVKTIGVTAFAHMNYLTTLNYNATSVADFVNYNDVFYDAGVSGDGFRLTIGNNVTRIPANLFDPRRAPANSPKVTTLTFASTSSCTTIGAYAFYILNDFVDLRIPDSVTTIDEHAFDGCSAVTYLTIGTGLKTFGTNCFAYMAALTSVGYFATSANDVANTVVPFLLSGNDDVNNNTVRVGSNVTRIPAYLFKDFSTLNDVNFNGTSCTTFGTGAFEGCTDIRRIFYQGSMDSWFANDFANNAANPAYASNKAILWVTNVGSSTYDTTDSGNTLALTSATYYRVQKIVSPSGTTTIKKFLFINLKQFTEIWLSDGVTTVQESVYSGNTGATLVVLPASITTIGNSAFSGCSNIANVYYKGSIDSWVSVDMSNSTANPIGASTKTNRTFWVGSTGRSANVTGNTGSTSFYQTYYKVVNYYTTRDLSTIKSYAFANWIQLRMLIIEDTLRTIAESAFNGTTGITGTQADGIKIYTSEGALVVESSVETTLPLYSTDGRLVERLQIAAGKNIFNTLEKGLYIVNGKKVTIK